jgi:hypothetical protein
MALWSKNNWAMNALDWKEVLKEISEYIDNDKDIVFKLSDQFKSVETSVQPANKN